eukprot:1153551-Pelagomonas_calceolata.AAC.2
MAGLCAQGFRTGVLQQTKPGQWCGTVHIPVGLVLVALLSAFQLDMSGFGLPVMGLHKVYLGAVGLNILSLGYVCFVGATHMSINPLVAGHGTSLLYHPPYAMPKYIYLDLPHHAIWSNRTSPVCDICDSDDIQDEKYVLFRSSNPQ